MADWKKIIVSGSDAHLNDVSASGTIKGPIVTSSNLNPLLNSIKFKSKKFKNIEKFLRINYINIKNKWPKKLPSGIIHGDLFIDNIFFKNNKLSGIIDFYFAANDYFMYEIAICVNALCFDKHKNKFILNKNKVRNLIKGYEKVKKISIKEKNSLKI